MMWWDHGCGAGFWGGGWGMMFPGLFMLLVVAGIVLAALMLVRHSSNSQSGREAVEPDGLAILHARYARGEIERDEYLRMKADLTTQP